MADSKITDLTNEAAPVGADLIAIVDDVAGTPVTKKATLTALAGSAPFSGTYAPLASIVTEGAVVNAEQSTTSASFTDLATAGPAVTINVPSGVTQAIVILTATIDNNNAAGGGAMGFAISGATTVAANFDQSIFHQNVNSYTLSAALWVTGLSAGSTTFTAKYVATANTPSFGRRNLIVQLVP